MTPKFIQIVATSTDNHSNLYGLTADGAVYKWIAVYDDPANPHYQKMHYVWAKCENQETIT